MDRFKSPRIQSDADLLKVMIYIDLNPKRARMVTDPREYQWTSYHYYAHGKAEPLITPAPSYLNLGRSDRERQQTYQSLVNEILQNDWKEKKDYSSVPFIGNPDWVLHKTKALKKVQIKTRDRWKRHEISSSTP